VRSVGRTTALFLVGCAVLWSAPAFAQSLKVSDPSGDGLHGSRLDITAVKVANRDHAIVTTISLERVGHGHVAVWIQARGDSPHSAVAVVGYHRARGDKSQLLTAAGIQECDGLRVRWEEATDRVRARMPSRCLADGDYGAVRVRTITEINGGDDADLAPNGPAGRWFWTEWISRG